MANAFNDTRTPQSQELPFPQQSTSLTDCLMISEEERKAATVACDPYPWILHPAVDLLFCCGGFLCLLLAFIIYSGIAQQAELQSSSLGLGLLYLNVAGQLLIATSHQPATLWRVFVSKPTRESVGPFVFISGVGLAACGIYALFHGDFTGVLVRITFVWSIQHTLAQAYGVSLIYCMKRRYYLSGYERTIFYWMFQTGLIYLAVRMFTYANFVQTDLYGLQLPIIGPVPEWICSKALAFFQLNSLLFVTVICHKYVREKVLIPFPAIATTFMAFATLSLTYLLPPAFVIFIPTFYHASQYLVVTLAYYLKERGLPPGVAPANISAMLSKEVVFNYLVIISATGAVLYIGIPRLLYELGFDRSVCFCVVYCVFNLHHYLADAALWKMRDPEVRRLLIT